MAAWARLDFVRRATASSQPGARCGAFRGRRGLRPDVGIRPARARMATICRSDDLPHAAHTAADDRLETALRIRLGRDLCPLADRHRTFSIPATRTLPPILVREWVGWSGNPASGRRS